MNIKKVFILTTFVLSLFVLELPVFSQNQIRQPVPKAADYINQAMTFFNKNELEKALQSIKEAEKLEPKDYTVQFNLGTVYFAMQRFEESANAFSKAVQADNRNWLPQLWLCRAQASSGKMAEAVASCKEAERLNPSAVEVKEDLALIYSRSNQYNEAFPILLKLLENRPDDLKLLTLLSEVYINRGSLAQALEVQQKIARIAPDLPEIYSVLSETYNKLGKIKESIEAGKEYIKRVPKDFTGYMLLGRVLAENGSSEEAIEYLQKAIELKPDFWYAHNLLGDSYKTFGDLEKSAANYRKAVSLNPNEYFSNYNLAKVLISLKRYEEAVEPAKVAVKMRPQLIETYGTLGLAYLESGRFEDAIEILTQAQRISPANKTIEDFLRVARERRETVNDLPKRIEEVKNNPRDADARASLAFAYQLQGNFKKAEAELMEALKIDPQSGELNNLVGVFYTDSDKPEQAIPYYQRAAELKKHHVIYLSLGNALYKVGKFDEAVTALNKSIEIKPDFISAYLTLGDIYQKRGKREEALATLKKAFGFDNLDIRINTRLAILYVNTGDKESAMRHYELIKSQNPQAADDVLKYIVATFGK